MAWRRPILLIGPLGTNFNEILIGIRTFWLKEMRLKMSSANWRPFCLGLNVLTMVIYSIMCCDHWVMHIKMPINAILYFLYCFREYFQITYTEYLIGICDDDLSKWHQDITLYKRDWFRNRSITRLDVCLSVGFWKNCVATVAYVLSLIKYFIQIGLYLERPLNRLSFGWIHW